jgi:hypothetical protein
MENKEWDKRLENLSQRIDKEISGADKLLEEMENSNYKMETFMQMVGIKKPAKRQAKK